METEHSSPIEEGNALLSLGTLSSQLLGVVAILAQEAVRAKAVDVDRFRQRLEGFWDEELATPELTAADVRMIESVRKVLRASISEAKSRE